MNVVIFLGPTLSVDEARAILPARYLPPVGQGDVYRICHEQPAAIGIIDGAFEHIPAVWHKEILWALARGIHVFGSASMGALRAAELAPFGMVGVGAIFDAVRSGELEDDDEVAVAHADVSEGYRPMSEAMVNIRATLRAAVTGGAIDPATQSRLERIAKELAYPERSFVALLAAARHAELTDNVLDRLRQFLATGQINQKRLDALQMLRTMADLGPALAKKRRATFVFEHTDAWDQAMSALDAERPAASSSEEAHDHAAIVEELRLRGRLFAAVHRGAMLRAAAERQAVRERMTVTPELRYETQESFRHERALEDNDTTRRWMRDNDLDAPGFGRIIESEARLRWFTEFYGVDGGRHIKTEVVAMGEYPSIAARARHKHELLAARGLTDPMLSDAGLSESELTRWYFEDRLGRPQPPDLVAYLREVAFRDPEAFRRAALREYLYLTLVTQSSP